MDHPDLNVKIYYEDTDAGGVVYHANYLRYMERARGEWLSALGITHRRLAEESHVAFVVRRMEISYKVPARLDDTLVVRTHLRSFTPVRLVFRQDVLFRDSGVLAVAAEVEVASISLESRRPARIPPELADRIREEEEPGSSSKPADPPRAVRSERGTLEKAGHDEVDLLAELNLRLLEEEHYDRSFTRKEIVARMHDLLDTGYDALFVKSSGAIAGYLLVNRNSDPIYIRQFYIEPAFRRRGLGRAAVEELKQRYGTEVLDVEVMAWNELGTKFWNSLGFRHRYNGLRLTP